MKNIFYSTAICFSLFSYSLNAQWVQTNGPHNLVSSLAISGSNLFVGVYNSVYLSTDNGDHWTDLNSGFGVSTFEVAGTNIYAGSDNRVYLSTNNGKNWKIILNGLKLVTGLTHGLELISGLALVGPNLLVGGYGGIFLSDNNGASWAPVDSGLPFPSFQGHFLVRQNINGTNSRDVFVATGAAGDPNPDLIYRSIDNGVSWSMAGNNFPNLFTIYMGIGPIVALPNNSGGTTILTTIFSYSCGSCKGGVYRSTNDGSSWEAADTTMRSISSFAVSTLFEGNYLFAGTFGNGVYLSTNSGTDWIQVNSGLADLDIETLVISENYLIAGTSSGVWRRPLSELVTNVKDKFINASNTFTLNQNYPNPFNPSTKIDFTIPQSSFVTLIVYNVLGEEVASLVNETKAPGNYEVNFNASNLPSGIYFYKLQAGSFTESKKMILLK